MGEEWKGVGQGNEVGHVSRQDRERKRRDEAEGWVGGHVGRLYRE